MDFHANMTKVKSKNRHFWKKFIALLACFSVKTLADGRGSECGVAIFDPLSHHFCCYLCWPACFSCRRVQVNWLQAEMMAIRIWKKRITTWKKKGRVNALSYRPVLSKISVAIVNDLPIFMKASNWSELVDDGYMLSNWKK